MKKYKSKFKENDGNLSFDVYAKRHHSNDFISSYINKADAEKVVKFLNSLIKQEAVDPKTEKYYID